MVATLFKARGLAHVVLSLMLGVTAVAASLVNERAGPPRSVFHVLPSHAAQPDVVIGVRTLGQGRFRLILRTIGFQFTEICMATAESLPIGHAHVYVDGEKVASAYYPVLDIGPLAPGIREIKVVMRGQDHRAIIGRDGLVQARTSVFVTNLNGEQRGHSES